MTTQAQPTGIALKADNVGQLKRPDVAVPEYDRSTITRGIVHFGVGGFHRAHQAMYLDQLMNKGLAKDWGIFGIGLLPPDERMAEVMAEQDCLYTLVTKAPDGTHSARVIGSLVGYLWAPNDPGAVLDVLVSPEIRVVTMTVTEAGYNVHRVTGDFDPDGPGIAEDLANPGSPSTVFGFVVEGLARRRAAGLPPFTVVSCDNVQGNGHVTKHAITGFAKLRDPELAAWIDENVSFPNSMVDRITPATTPADIEMVREEFGIVDGWPVVCEPFVQWVVEDSFTGDRPPFEEVGIQMVEDVEPYELMKLRLLNASHQALGYAGYLAGYRYVHDTAHDPAFADLLRGYMREEAIASLRPVPGVDLDRYVEQLIERFGNPEIRDTLARLNVDSSERIPKFVLPVVRYQLGVGNTPDRAICVLAAWARYDEGTDEKGEPIDIVDPARDQLHAIALTQRENPLAFVQNRDVFGELVDDPRFRDSYLRSLNHLFEHGAQSLVETLARTGHWS